MDLYPYENEDREHGVGTDVNVIIMSDVLYGIGLGECSSSVLPYFTTFPYQQNQNNFVCLL